MDDEKACAVCRGPTSSRKNPIVFCDGKDCDIPVHKRCYDIDVVPEGSWFCQRCEDNIVPNQTRMLCCPNNDGAVKRSAVANRYIHIVCAAWCDGIITSKEPWDYNPRASGGYDGKDCYICKKRYGFCIQCDHSPLGQSRCQRWFHVSCAIKTSLIHPIYPKPENSRVRCAQHKVELKRQSESVSSSVSKRRRIVPKSISFMLNEQSDSEESQSESSENESSTEDVDMKNRRKRSINRSSDEESKGRKPKKDLLSPRSTAMNKFAEMRNKKQQQRNEIARASLSSTASNASNASVASQDREREDTSASQRNHLNQITNSDEASNLTITNGSARESIMPSKFTHHKEDAVENQNEITSKSSLHETNSLLLQLNELQRQLLEKEREASRLRNSMQTEREQKRTEMEMIRQEQQRATTRLRTLRSHFSVILAHLNLRLPTAGAFDPNNVDDYVRELRDIILRSQVDRTYRDRVISRVIDELNLSNNGSCSNGGLS
ncbi:uncharacterized protein VTP21DRAFT_6317 [Calcarisporiella thermophila]|uniref:uncharacterized protein n=1 Tax=Calcarisporiella thermophila TaxID=911321 RepID=UPI003743CF43